MCSSRRPCIPSHPPPNPGTSRSVSEVIDIECSAAFVALVFVATVDGAFLARGEQVGDLNAVGLLSDVVDSVAAAMPANWFCHGTCSFSGDLLFLHSNPARAFARSQGNHSGKVVAWTVITAPLPPITALQGLQSPQSDQNWAFVTTLNPLIW